MSGFVPTEGKTLITTIVQERISVDRDADLELGLFTNVSPGSSITQATITEPTGTGYARITLTDGSWSISGAMASYAQQTFTGGSGGWAGSIQGYFISTKSSGGTKRLLYIEVDSAGPYTINSGDTYKITPNITVT